MQNEQLGGAASCLKIEGAGHAADAGGRCVLERPKVFKRGDLQIEIDDDSHLEVLTMASVEAYHLRNGDCLSGLVRGASCIAIMNRRQNEPEFATTNLKF